MDTGVDDVEKLVERVVRETGKSEKDIRSRMNERKDKTHGLLSDYGAIYAVAKELGVELNSDDGSGSRVVSPASLVKIKDVKPQTPVNLVGRVKVVYSTRDFDRKDGSKGRFASLIMVDDSGEIRLVLWDENTELTKHVHIGDVLLVKNAYARENRGVVELHAGNLTTTTVNPPNLKVKLPEVKEKRFKVSELAKDLLSISLVCRVTSYYPKTEFKRGDGSAGMRASFIGEDETGKIRVVLWDKCAETPLGNGDIVKIENAYTREGMNQDLELQAGNRSRLIKVSNEELKLPSLTPETQGKASIRLSDIKPGMSGFTVEARILRVYPPREYAKGKMASLVVGDGNGTMRVVLWDDKSAIAEELKRGDPIRISNAYSKANISDEPEIHVGKYSSITLNQGLALPSASEIEKSLTVEKRIIDLESNDRYVRIKGRVVGLDENRPIMYMTCPGCGKRVQNLSGEWFCESCGDIDPDMNMMLSMVIEDDTGNIRAVSFKDNAEKLLGLDVEETMNLIGETQDETAPLKHARESLVGKSVSLVGRVKYNDYSDQLEFLVDEIPSL